MSRDRIVNSYPVGDLIRWEIDNYGEIIEYYTKDGKKEGLMINRPTVMKRIIKRMYSNDVLVSSAMYDLDDNLVCEDVVVDGEIIESRVIFDNGNLCRRIGNVVRIDIPGIGYTIFDGKSMKVYDLDGKYYPLSKKEDVKVGSLGIIGETRYPSGKVKSKTKKYGIEHYDEDGDIVRRTVIDGKISDNYIDNLKNIKHITYSS